MKKSLFFLLSLALLLIAGSIEAQEVNKLIAGNVSCMKSATVDMPFYLENTNPSVVALQFEVTVPTDVSIDVGASAARMEPTRSADHRVRMVSLGNQSYRVMVISPTNKPFKANKGKLFTLKTSVASDAALQEGETYPVVVKNVVISDSLGHNIMTAFDNGSITLETCPDFVVSNIQVTSGDVSPGEQVSLTWEVKNIGARNSLGGWSEQITFVSDDTGENLNLTTMHYTSPLNAGETVGRSAEVLVPRITGLDGKFKVYIKIVPNSDSGESVEYQGNNQNVSLFSYMMLKKLYLTIPDYILTESNQDDCYACLLERSGSRVADETWTLTKTAGDNRVVFPDEVTISHNSSSQWFYMHIVGDDLLNGDTVTYACSAASRYGYPATVASGQVIDDELPTLSLYASKSNVAEGETFQLTVISSAPRLRNVKISLSNERPARFTMPSSVILRAGQTAVSVDVTAVEDDVINLQEGVLFTATANRFHQGQTEIIVGDNDMPTFEMTLSPTTISEGGGARAIRASITRSGKVNVPVTIRLSDDSDGQLYYSTSTVSLKKGQTQANFNIGVRENAMMEGDRDVVFKAAVYVSSCNCEVGKTSGGVMTETIHIIDNDGPALKLTTAYGNMLEGSTDNEFVITLNNTPSKPVTVNISCDRESDVSYPKSVTVPAGQREATFLVTLLRNQTAGDSRRITFTATADGYSKDVCTVMGTDQTLPDGVVASLRVVSEDITIDKKFVVETTIQNIGYDTLFVGSIISYAYHANEYNYFIERDVLPGKTITQRDTLPATGVAGTFEVKATINPTALFPEIDLHNNTSEPAELVVKPFFTATATPQKRIYLNTEKVTISGRATGLRPNFQDIEVYIINGSTRYTVKSRTDGYGQYQADWWPQGNLAGHFIVGACTPDEGLKTESSTFEMYGMRRNDSGFILKELETDEEVTGYVDIINHGTLKLNNITVTAPDLPSTVSMRTEGIRSLKAGSNDRIYFHLTGRQPSTGNDWQTVKLHLESEEGAVYDQPIYFYVYPAVPVLKADIDAINTTMTLGKTRNYEFTLRNEGRQETGDITLDLGNLGWLRAATPIRMASLKTGEQATVVLQLTPTPAMELNGITRGNFAINCANGNGLSIPMMIETVSEETGTLIIDVWDEFTMNTEEAPHVEGATVNVLHPATGKLLRQAVTGSDGLATFEMLPEGRYNVQVTHPRHSSWTQSVVVNPSRTTKQRAFIPYSAITVDMHYEKTEIEDEYDIVTSVTYETNVPKAVVTLDMPDKMVLDEIETPYLFYAHLTNVGLITAFDVTFHIPAEANGYTFTPLLEGPWDILPQQTVSIPVEINKAEEGTSESRIVGPSYLPRPGQPYTAPRRVGSAIACGIGAFARYFNRCTSGDLGDIEDEVQKHMQLKEVCGGGGGGIVVDLHGSPGSPGGRSYHQDGSSSTNAYGVPNEGWIDAMACNPDLAEKGPDWIKNFVGTACPTISWTFAFLDGINKNDWKGVLQNYISTVLPAYVDFKAPNMRPWVDWYTGLANVWDMGANSRTAPELEEAGEAEDSMADAHGKRKKASFMVVVPSDCYGLIPPSYIWTDASGEQHKDSYESLMKDVGEKMRTQWLAISQGRIRTKQTDEFEEPIYCNDRFFEDPQPETGNVELPDWYPSAMRAWSDNTVAPQYSVYHELLMIHELFGEWGWMLTTMDEMLALADTLNVIAADPDMPIETARKKIEAVFADGAIAPKNWHWCGGVWPETMMCPVPYIANRFINTIRMDRGETLPEDEDNYIHYDVIVGCANRIKKAMKEVNRAGYDNDGQMIEAENKKMADYLQQPRSSVCATVKLQIEQKMTMTRQAVRGTLTVTNGSENQPMRDVKLSLRVTDSYGNVADSHIMEITTESLEGFTGQPTLDSGWELGAKETGVARILFIPTRYAAPDEPMQYTFAGTISFIDPFTGLEMTRDLEVERLTVNPSPVLDLTYFMQRDILGDDALTKDVVEAKVPSQFSLIITNKGKGDATKVRMVTQQPQIVENEKGLLADFEILSSQLNGGNKTLALGESVATDFGTIPAGTSSYAQWWMTSSLTGHFVKYDVQATHVTSYDNPDLSLLDQVTIHELIHQIEMPGTDTTPATIAFLANDEEDYHDYPDQLYTMDGQAQPVSEATGARWTKESETSYRLKVTASAAGWNYGNVTDPTGGTHRIAAVTRMSDNMPIPVTNFWQTDRTLVDMQEPVYENLIHYADEMPVTGETYLVDFEAAPADPLTVTSISGVPQGEAYTREQVGIVTIAFDRPIDEATFTTADLRLMHQGEDKDLSSIDIVKVNEQTFQIDLTSLTTLDGYYLLTVQTADITDANGVTGKEGVKAGWTQIEDGKANLTMLVEPEGAGTVTPGSSKQDYFGVVNLTATHNTGYYFSGWKEGETLLSSSSTYQYTMYGPKTVTAVFKPERCQVNINWNENRGTVTGAGTGLFDYNTKVTIAAEPRSGYYFKGWTSGYSTVPFSIEPTLTFTVRGVENYTAVFEPIDYMNVLLDENADDNTSVFANPRGKYFMVSANRQLKAFQWNTLCLPFDVTEQEVNKLWGYATMIVAFTSASGDLLNFDYVYELKAGVPYLVKPERTVATPKFEIDGNDIVVASEPQAIEHEGFQFVGNYTPHTWDIYRGDGHESYYGTSSGKILRAKATTAALQGMRAYFVVPDGVASARIGFGGIVTSIDEVVDPSEILGPTRIYNLQGQYVGSDVKRLPCGLYIINGRKQQIRR